MDYRWDRCEGEETILRMMTLGTIEDVKYLLKKEGKEKLMEIFLRNTRRFHGRDRSFWQVVLEVSDEVFERRAKKNFRNASKLRYFV